jgi:hypothetical protein
VNTFVRNIVLACPGATWDEYLEEGKALASFYAELLGMRIIREDWIKIATDPDASPQLAFGDGPGVYTPPRWPDPAYPQQLHLDVFVGDIEETSGFVERLGATLLQKGDGFRTYADPCGHPFCLYPDDGASDGARIRRIVFDCAEPLALADFYAELMDMRERVEEAADRVVIAKEGHPQLAFQRAEYVPPRWPDPAYPQQVHLDVHTDDSPAAQELALGLGATKLESKGGSCPVFADPASHPFCLCAPGQWIRVD